MLRRSPPARSPLWSLENNSVYLEKQQFLCEGMGLLRTCSTGEGFLPFQVLAFFFLKARKATLRQGEWETRRAKVWKEGVGLDTSRAASAAITRTGVGENNGVQ